MKTENIRFVLNHVINNEVSAKVIPALKELDALEKRFAELQDENLFFKANDGMEKAINCLGAEGFEKAAIHLVERRIAVEEGRLRR